MRIAARIANYGFTCLMIVMVWHVTPASAQDESRYEFPIVSNCWFDFGTPALPALPADFFAPGSEPFEDHVYVTMIPKDGGSGNDFLPWSDESDFPLTPGDPVFETKLVPVRFTDLSAISTVQVDFLGGSYQETWSLALDLSVVPAPDGQQNQTKTHENGGVFDSVMYLQPRFTFTRLSDGQEVVADTGLMGWSPLVLEALDVPWVHEVHEVGAYVGPHDDFVPGIVELVPGDPTSQCPTVIVFDDVSAAAHIELSPAETIPLPDAFTSLPGGGEIVFGPIDNPPLPAGFFGPGSEPFEGAVPIKGKPLGATEWGEYETGDTLIRRFSDPFDRCELPHPDDREIDIEIIALTLESIDPVEVFYEGNPTPESWVMYVDVSPSAIALGTMTVTKTHENGGVYNSTFDIHPRYTFERVSDGYAVVWDTAAVGASFLRFDALGGHWVHATNPDLQLMAADEGSFVPGVEEMAPGDILSQEARVLNCAATSGAGIILLEPAHRNVSAVTIPPVWEAGFRASPNPFNPATTLRFSLKMPGPVSLRIYDLHGRLVRTIDAGVRGTGPNEISWRGVDDAGRSVASGVYLGVLATNEGAAKTKMALIK